MMNGAYIDSLALHYINLSSHEIINQSHSQNSFFKILQSLSNKLP